MSGAGFQGYPFYLIARAADCDNVLKVASASPYNLFILLHAQRIATSRSGVVNTMKCLTFYLIARAADCDDPWCLYDHPLGHTFYLIARAADCDLKLLRKNDSICSFLSYCTRSGLRPITGLDIPDFSSDFLSYCTRSGLRPDGCAEVKATNSNFLSYCTRSGLRSTVMSSLRDLQECRRHDLLVAMNTHPSPISFLLYGMRFW